MIHLCTRCGQPYLAEDNRDGVCSYHPGKLMDYDRVGQLGPGLPGDFWDCCGGQVETTPLDVPGCARGAHIEAPPGDPGPFKRDLEAQARWEADLVRSRLTRWPVERGDLAQRRTIEFLGGTGDPGPIQGRRWRHLLADVRILEDDRAPALRGLLSDPQYAAIRRQALAPLLRSARSVATAEWPLDRLLAAFPGLRPDTPGVSSRPRDSASGKGRYEDEEAHEAAEVTLTLAPSDDFVIRVGEAWPRELPQPRRQALEREIVRGILKAAAGLVTPPALACDVWVSAIACGSDPQARVLHAAAHQAFGEASRRCEWTLSVPFPEVTITPDEDLDVAHKRAVQAFKAAGFQVMMKGPAEPASSGNPFWRAFTFYAGVTGRAGCAHIFFVCPYPWTAERAQGLDHEMSDLSYSYGHDGEATEMHVLSAYPRPGAGW